MKKIYILSLLAFILCGCSATMNINLEKNSITEEVNVQASNDTEYTEIKNWNGFPLTLYYDQELSNPFNTSEKENGVPYYNTEFNDNDKTAKVTGVFNFTEHTRSSIIRNCFKYYEIRKVDNKNIYDLYTSHGLICDFNNFDINITTPYKVINHNADSFNSETNTYTWKITKSNSQNANVFLEVDFTKNKNSTGTHSKKKSQSTTKTNMNTTKSILLILIIIPLLLVLLVTKLYKKHKKISKI